MISEYTGQPLRGQLAVPNTYGSNAVAQFMPTHLELARNAWLTQEGVDVLDLKSHVTKFADFKATLIEDGDSSLILYEYKTEDKGLIPTWSLELSTFCHSLPMRCAEVLYNNRALLESNGLSIVDCGRPDLVIPLSGYNIPSRLVRNQKKAKGFTTSITYLSLVPESVLRALLAQTVYAYMEVPYTSAADEHIRLNEFLTCQLLFPAMVFATKYNNRIVALSFVTEQDGQWCWLSTLRDYAWFSTFDSHGLNLMCAIITDLIWAATLNGAHTFNLGIDQYPYKRMFNPTLVWHHGLEFAR